MFSSEFWLNPLYRGDIIHLYFNHLFAMAQITQHDSRKIELVRNLSLYTEFQAEREEVLKHKWIESEKLGRDIGFDQALVDWIVNHRPSWRKSRQIVD
jgi:hypothetical protein